MTCETPAWLGHCLAPACSCKVTKLPVGNLQVGLTDRGCLPVAVLRLLPASLPAGLQCTAAVLLLQSCHLLAFILRLRIVTNLDQMGGHRAHNMRSIYARSWLMSSAQFALWAYQPNPGPLLLVPSPLLSHRHYLSSA